MDKSLYIVLIFYTCIAWASWFEGEELRFGRVTWLIFLTWRLTFVFNLFLPPCLGHVRLSIVGQTCLTYLFNQTRNITLVTRSQVRQEQNRQNVILFYQSLAPHLRSYMHCIRKWTKFVIQHGSKAILTFYMMMPSDKGNRKCKDKNHFFIS